MSPAATDPTYRAVRRRAPHVVQHVATDCGMAALASCAGVFGHYVSVGQLWQRFGRSHEALSFAQLQRAAASVGFEAHAYHTDSLQTLPRRHLPAVVHLVDDGGHFIAVDRRVGGWGRCSDPAGDQSWRRLRDLDTSGNVLSIAPADETVVPTGVSPLRRFSALVRSVRLRLALIITLSLLATTASLVVSQYSGLLIDMVAGSADRSARLIPVLALVMIAFTALAVLLQLASMRQNYTSSVALERSLVTRYVSRLVVAPRGLFRAYSPGDLVARFSDLSEVRSVAHDTILTGALSVVTLVGASAVMVLQAPVVAVPAIVGVVLVAIIRWRAGRSLLRLQRQNAARESALTQAMLETVEGSSQSRLARWDGYLIPRMTERFDSLMSGVRQVFVRSSWLESGGNFAESVIMVVVLAAVALAASRGETTPGAIASFAILMPMVTSNASALTSMQQDLQRAVVSVDRLGDVTDLRSPYDDEPLDRATADTAVAAVSHRDDRVLFSADDIEILVQGDRVAATRHLEIRDGEVLGVAGANGAGKSTLCRLVAGLEENWSGEVHLDGETVPLEAIDRLAAFAVYVPETGLLTSDSLRNNVFLGSERTSTDAELVLEVTGVRSLAERLPLGFDTPIGPGGITLSGGERQRVQIARALLESPRVLILDEATRLLDTVSQAELPRAVINAGLARSVVIVSHSDSLADFADRLVSVEAPSR